MESQEIPECGPVRQDEHGYHTRHLRTVREICADTPRSLALRASAARIAASLRDTRDPRFTTGDHA